MSKPFARKIWMPAVWILAIAIVAVVAIAASSHVRARQSSARATQAAAATISATERGRLRANLNAMPLAFEPNQGQTDPQVKYMARGNGYTAFLTANETVFAMSEVTNLKMTGTGFPARVPSNSHIHTNDSAIHMKLVGANQQPTVTAASELPGHSNYFIGSDRSKWQSGVKQFAQVSYSGVYPGVNMSFHGQQRQLEFDFLVAPGADAAPIRFDVSGARHISTDASGNLVLSSSAGDVLLHKPVAYQGQGNSRQAIDSKFIVAKNRVSFELGPYDRSRELVIDPSVTYATYLGGTAQDDGIAIAVNSSGNAYVTGQTKSTNFPTANALHSATGGGFDAFIAEFSSDGSSLVYSTYIGGSGDDSGNAIAVDASGNAFVAGGTSSANFPTQGAFQGTLKGAQNAFVLELNSSGSALTYSTFLGGTGNDVATGLALDSSGNAYVVGSTSSVDFPLHLPIQAAIVGTANGFVTKLNSTGNALGYSTYLGAGTADFAEAIAVDGSGKAYVTGATKNSAYPATAGVVQGTCGTAANCNGGLYDAFVTVINAAGNGFVYSTFLGGEGNDEGFGIAVDGSGDAYVTGLTSSSAFPLKVPLQATLGGGSLPTDAFVTELNPTGTAFVYSTYLGGSGDDTGVGIAVDSNKNAYVTGGTTSTNFPMHSATQGTLSGQSDAFVTEIASGGTSFLFSTYLGGSLNEDTIPALGTEGAIAVDSAGSNIYVTGNTTSTNFPTVAPKQSTAGGTGDAYVAKFSTGVSAANFTITNGALSPASGSPGVSATATITVTSTNNFSSAVALACAVAPVVSKGPTCSFSNPGPSVTPAANASATATLNVATTAASARLDPPSDRHSGMFYAMLVPLFGVTLLGAGIGPVGSRRRKLFGFLMLGMVLAGLLILPACSSGGGNGGGGNSGTPAGTYTITVTGSSNGAQATGTPAISLTVN